MHSTKNKIIFVVVIITLLALALLLFLVTNQSKGKTQVTKELSTLGSQAKVTFGIPEGFKENGIGMTEILEENSSKTPITVEVQAITDDYIPEKQVNDTRNFVNIDIQDKSLLCVDYNLPNPSNDLTFHVKDYYWENVELESQTVRFTCYGEQDENDKIHRVCEEFIKDFSLSNLVAAAN